MKRIMGLFLLLCLCTGLAGCGTSDVSDGGSVSNPGVEAISSDEALEIAEKAVKGMSLDEKIGQMFMVDLDKLSKKGESVTKMTKELRKNIEKYKIGGVVLDNGNIQSVEELKQLNKDLSDCLAIPMYIATEEEGGGSKSIAAHNDDIKGTGYTTPAEMGQSMTDTQLEDTGEVIAKELSGLGFNMNFSPTADVTGAETPVELSAVRESAAQVVGPAPVWKKPSKKASKKAKKKARALYDKKCQEYEKKLDAVMKKFVEENYTASCFGQDEDKVSDAVSSMVTGMHKQGIATVLKTFPGIATVTRYHKMIPCDMNTGLSRLRRINFAPFDSGIDEGADFIMVGHVSLSKIDGTTPSSFSSTIMTELLREQMGFEGVVLTEQMDVPVITNNYSVEQAVLRAVVAGADMVYDPDNIAEAVMALKRAVMFQDISEKKINQAVLHIVQNKVLRGVYKVN